jgi:hypothetical protein
MKASLEDQMVHAEDAREGTPVASWLRHVISRP